MASDREPKADEPAPANPGPAEPARAQAVRATTTDRDGDRLVWPRATLILIVLAMGLRPGDASWIYDEPRLILIALQSNAAPTREFLIPLPFSLAERGLQGTRGANYGPAAAWFYQVCLAVTHDLPAIVVIHALFMGGVTALALYWLARVMRVSVWLAVVTMLSPWVWHYSRQLWDNSFNIPLSALLLASYGDFLLRGRAWSFRLAVLCIAIMPLVHFMSLPVVAPVALHLAMFHRRALWRWKWSLLAIVAGVNVLAWPYWKYLAGAFHQDVPSDASAVYGWLYPLLGAHHLTAAGLGNSLGDEWLLSIPSIAENVHIAALLTLIAYPVCWIGMGLAARRAWRVLRRDQRATVVDHLALICLAAWVCQTLLDGLERVYAGPHYFNATWIVYGFFVWLAADALASCGKRAGKAGGLLLGIYAALLVFVTAAAAGKIIRDGGSWYLGYGTTIGNQMEAMRQLNRFSADSPKNIEAPQWAQFPYTFATLQQLTPSAAEPRPKRQLWIHYRNLFPGDARFAVEDFPLPGGPAR